MHHHLCEHAWPSTPVCTVPKSPPAALRQRALIGAAPCNEARIGRCCELSSPCEPCALIEAARTVCTGGSVRTVCTVKPPSPREPCALVEAVPCEPRAQSPLPLCLSTVRAVCTGRWGAMPCEPCALVTPCLTSPRERCAPVEAVSREPCALRHCHRCCSLAYECLASWPATGARPCNGCT